MAKLLLNLPLRVHFAITILILLLCLAFVPGIIRNYVSPKDIVAIYVFLVILYMLIITMVILIGKRIVQEFSRNSDRIVQEFSRSSDRLVNLLESNKDYVERRLRSLLEVELAIISEVALDEARLSKDASDLLKFAQEKLRSHEQQLRFTFLAEQSNIKDVYLAELFDGIEKVFVPIGAINEETGHANHVDLLYVIAIARYLQCRNVFEFGTYLGRTAYHLTYATEGAVVTTLNLLPEQDTRVAPYLGTYFHGTDREPFIKQILCDSRDFDTTPYRKKMDFIFVDGDHSYEIVKNDTAKAFDMLSPGGVIIWHDYAPKSPEVVTFFREFTQRQALFRIRNTCLLVHLDGIDPMTFIHNKMQPSLVSNVHDK
jgi:predicted O-methyltransferase YrrM